MVLVKRIWTSPLSFPSFSYTLFLVCLCIYNIKFFSWHWCVWLEHMEINFKILDSLSLGIYDNAWDLGTSGKLFLFFILKRTSGCLWLPLNQCRDPNCGFMWHCSKVNPPYLVLQRYNWKQILSYNYAFKLNAIYFTSSFEMIKWLPILVDL